MLQGNPDEVREALQQIHTKRDIWENRTCGMMRHAIEVLVNHKKLEDWIHGKDNTARRPASLPRRRDPVDLPTGADDSDEGFRAARAETSDAVKRPPPTPTRPRTERQRSAIWRDRTVQRGR